MKIWCLFSVDNNYDQPDNNLVAWWPEKPSIETLAKAMGSVFPSVNDESTLAIVKIWGGHAQEFGICCVTYRLEEISEGVLE